MPFASDPCSRRQLLAAGAGALAVATAGCVGERGHEWTTETGRPNVDSSHEYETLVVRTEGDKHFVYPDADAATAAAEADDDEYVPSHHRRQFVIDDDGAEALWIGADDDALEGDVRADDIRTFVTETEFDTQSIVIDQRTIEDCYERHVLGITAEDDSFRANYCQQLKPPDVPCEADVDRMEAVIFRIERPYDKAPTSSGSSESMSCHRDVIVTERDGGVNDSDDARDSSEATANTSVEAPGGDDE